MAVKGYKRYIELFRNIQNPFEYIINRSKRKKRALRFETRPNTIKFEVTRSLYPVFKEIFMEDVYDIAAVTEALPVNPVVIDIGANAGFFDILLLSKNPGASIFAYEPLPTNFAALQKLTADNKWLDKKIYSFQYAVTGTLQQNVALYIEAAVEGSVVASVFSDFDNRNTQTITVPCITLSDIILHNNLAQIDVMKIDCEGSEYDILYNTDASLITRAKMLLIEVHDLDNVRNNITALNNHLMQMGYSTKHQPINNFCHALEAVIRN